MSLTTAINILFNILNTKVDDLSTISDPITIDRTISLADGSGANQADVIFRDTRTLADGANEVLDLYASGSLLDAFGTALTIETLKVLYLKNKSSDATLLVGGGTTPIGLCADATDIIKIPPGGILIWSAPDATGLDITTNKNLKLEHDGTGSSSMDIELIAIGVD
jgi:hypothetical protein